MLFFNLLAACIEGVSFACLLLSLAALTNEKIDTTWLNFFPLKGSNLFLLFLSYAIFLQILRSLSLYFGQLMTTLLTVRIQNEAQKKIFEKIFRMDFAQIAEFKKGDLMHYATSPPSFIPMLFDEYNRLIVSSLMIVAYLVIMIQLCLPLTFFILFFFGVAALVQKVLLTKISKASVVHSDHLADLSKESAQSLDGLKTVHLFQRQSYTLEKLDTILAHIASATKQLKKLNALIPSVNECLGVLLVGFSLLAGTFFLQNEGVFHASYLFTFLTLTYRLGVRLQHVMIAKGMLSYYAGPQHKLNEILAKETKQPSQNPLTTPPHFEETISFENVSFTYPGQTSHALKEISLSLPKNKVVALVGISGSGKSSLIDLLLRFHTPHQGAIKMDGKPIDSFSLNSWRELFGVVLQDTFLFNASIEENIRFGKLEATREEILEASKQAGADSFIQKLPKKYQTLVGEKGYRLSGGEKQRLALAQAIVRKAEILILDEATSHLDSQSEKMIQQTLALLRKDKTLLIVAHRLSTIQMADLIVVIENGKIVERGSHQHLLQLGGRYHLFWHLQTSPT